MRKHTTFPTTGRAVAVLFALNIALCIAAFGQQNRSTISGFVFDPDRRPVPEVYVELTNEVNSIIGRVRTDGSGRYFFSGLSSGRFTVRVLTTGTNYEGQPEDVEISGVGVTGRQLADNVQKDIYLRLRKSESEIMQLTGVLYAQAVPAEAEAAYKKAVQDLQDRKPAEGVEGLKRAIGLFPTYLVALEKLGMTLLAQEKYQEAREMFERAVAVYDRSFSSWYGLGYAQYALKDYPKVIESMEHAANLNTNSMRAQFLLGLSYRQMKDYQRSETALLRAAKIANGEDPDIHWNLALLYAHNLKRYKDAADQLEIYLKKSPDLQDKETIKKLIKQFRDKAKSGA